MDKIDVTRLTGCMATGVWRDETDPTIIHWTCDTAGVHKRDCETIEEADRLFCLLSEEADKRKNMFKSVIKTTWSKNRSLNFDRLKKLRDKKLEKFNTGVKDMRDVPNILRTEFDRVYCEILSGDIEVLNAILDDIAELEELVSEENG